MTERRAREQVGLKGQNVSEAAADVLDLSIFHILAREIAGLKPDARLHVRTNPAYIRVDRDLARTSDLASARASDLNRTREVAGAIDLASDLVSDLAGAIDLAIALASDRASELNRAHVRASAIVSAIDRAIDRASDRASAIAIALASHRAGFDAIDLVKALTSARDLTSAIVSASARDFARTLTSARDLTSRLARNLVRARDLASALTSHLGLNLNRALDLSLASARDLARDLARDPARNLARNLAPASAPASALTSALTSARDVAGARTALDRALHDFTGADLRDVDLTNVELEGLRWSPATRWPPGWADQLALDSVEVAPDIFEIRRGTAHAPAPV